MNYEPYKNVALVLLGSVGGYFVNRGWITAEQWTSIAGAIVSIGTVLWAIYKGQQNAVITAAANLPVVDQINVNDKKVSDSSSTPSNVVSTSAGMKK
jgi:hypothetical protein